MYVFDIMHDCYVYALIFQRATVDFCGSTMRDTVVVLLFWGVGYIPRYSPTPLHSIVNGGQCKQGLLQLRGGDAAGAEVQPGLRSLPSSVPPAALMTKKRRGADVAELARHVEGIGPDCSHPPAKARRAGRPPGKVKIRGSEKGVTAKKKRIKKVEEKGILCYRCRRSRSTLRQHSIMSFCSPIKENPTGHTTALDCDDAAKCCDVAKCEDAANDWDDAANTVDVNSLQHHHHNNTHFDIQQAPTYFHLNISTTAEGANGKAPGSLADDTVETVEQCSMLVCRQCRRPMEESAPVSSANSRIAIMRICPSIVKVRGYKRIAAEKKIAWRILESDAQRVMLRPCYFCGRRAAENPGGFNGINRVNHTLQYYDHDNIAAACKDCNTMKHDHSSQDFVNICRHVASFNEVFFVVMRLLLLLTPNTMKPEYSWQDFIKIRRHMASFNEFFDCNSMNHDSTPCKISSISVNTWPFSFFGCNTMKHDSTPRKTFTNICRHVPSLDVPSFD